MPRITLTLGPDVFDDLLRLKPRTLSLSSFCSLLVEQQALGLDSASKLPAYRVGAGTTGNDSTESDLQIQPAKPLAEDGLTPSPVEFLPDLPSQIVMGDGVGRESEGTPRKDPKQLRDNLLPHADLIFDFWRIKGGSKGERAWSLLQTECTKIQQLHGDDVLSQQLELAINGKWKGITLANLERFTKPQAQAAAGGYVDSITRDRIEREKFLSMFSSAEAA